MPLPLAAVPVATAATSMAPALWAGGLSALGSIGSSLIGAHSAKSQMKFQERMSGSAHQREMADLKKSGLNPLLTGKYGGSSTPPGTSFTPENPLSKAAETTMNARAMLANISNIEQQTTTNSALEGKYNEEGALANQKWQSEEVAKKLLGLQINSAKATSELYKTIGAAGKAAPGAATAMQIIMQWINRKQYTR